MNFDFNIFHLDIETVEREIQMQIFKNKKKRAKVKPISSDLPKKKKLQTMLSYDAGWENSFLSYQLVNIYRHKNRSEKSLKMQLNNSCENFNNSMKYSC